MCCNFSKNLHPNLHRKHRQNCSQFVWNHKQMSSRIPTKQNNTSDILDSRIIVQIFCHKNHIVLLSKQTCRKWHIIKDPPYLHVTTASQYLTKRPKTHTEKKDIFNPERIKYLHIDE